MLSSNTAAYSGPTPRVHTRADVLRESFPGVATAIYLRRSTELESGMVADFVALGWLRWEDGALVVTPAGPQAGKPATAGR